MTFYQTCLKSILRDLGFKQPGKGIVFTLGAVIYPKDARKVLTLMKPQGMERTEALELISTIHDAREKYNTERRDQFLKIFEI